MNLFELFAKIVLDTSEYEDGLDKAGKKTSAFGSKLKSGLGAAAKAGAAALTAASAGVVALTKVAVSNYGEYEQLVGGVETLFKQSADVVMGYAESAYRTAGMSANEYMETVTSFSASLLQSLDGDTAKAAEKADLAITDMADNANKMGSSMESIQNAYQGFAKQNYSMLDNLKLGYGGTAKEMYRLMQTAASLDEDFANNAVFSLDTKGHLEAEYADIVDAIHIVQTQMGITGTTALEAGTTIQGAISSMQAAWTNLITGLADGNANIEVLVSNLVTSLVGDGTEENLGVLGTIIPAIGTALKGVSSLVTTASSTIVPLAITTITDNLPAMLDAGMALLSSLATGIMDSLPEITEAAVGIVLQLTSAISAGLPDILQGGFDMLMTLVDGITSALPELIARLPEIITTIIVFVAENLPTLISAGGNILGAIIKGIFLAIPELIKRLPELIMAIANGISDLVWSVMQIGVSIVMGLYEGFKSMFAWISEKSGGALTAIIEGIKSGFAKVVDVGKNIVTGLWEGIKSMATWVKDKVTGLFSGLVDGIKDLLGIHSPSRVFAGIGKNMAAGLGEGWDDEFSGIKSDIENGMEFGSVDFSSSAIGKSSGAIINSVMQRGQETGGEYTINVNIDGERAASVLWNPLRAVGKQRGEAFA